MQVHFSTKAVCSGENRIPESRSKHAIMWTATGGHPPARHACLQRTPRQPRQSCMAMVASDVLRDARTLHGDRLGCTQTGHLWEHVELAVKTAGHGIIGIGNWYMTLEL